MFKYNYNLDVFREESEVSYYLLGAFMTDGCVKVYPNRKYVTLSSKDFDWLEIIKEIICPQLPIKPHGNCGILQFSSTEMANILITKGCINNKSITLKFPIVPEKYLPDFIRGCIDGDGCISQSSYTRKKNGITYIHNICYLCSSAELFIKEFYNIFNTQEIKCSLKLQSDKGKKIKYLHPHYRVNFTNSNAKKFLRKIYFPNHIVSMPRKKILAEKIINS